MQNKGKIKIVLPLHAKKKKKKYREWDMDRAQFHHNEYIEESCNLLSKIHKVPFP
jgi:hypothetical protein